MEEEIAETEISLDEKEQENEERKLPPSPPTYDSNTQTQKPFVVYENPCYDECETENSMVLYDNPCYYDKTINAPLLSTNATSELIDDSGECCLEFFYDKALDDGPMPMAPKCRRSVVAPFD